MRGDILFVVGARPSESNNGRNSDKASLIEDGDLFGIE
jgi:hypothetical protein